MCASEKRNYLGHIDVSLFYDGLISITSVNEGLLLVSDTHQNYQCILHFPPSALIYKHSTGHTQQKRKAIFYVS
jgi:hypothetical protein